MVYAADGDIFVVDANGATEPRQLTNDPAFDQQPVFSPDGRRIAFVSDRDGDQDIYVMLLDGSSVRALTDNDADDNQPAWSPDSSQVVFSSTANGNRDIYTVDISTLTLQQFTADPAAEAAPQFSTDGTTILFMSDTTGNWDIFTLGTVSGSRGQIVALPGNQQFPSLSADGSEMLYSGDRTTDGSFEIFRVPIANNQIQGAPEQLTTAEGILNTLPSLSPDGSTFVFVQVLDGVPTIRRANVGSSDSTALVVGSDPHFYPLIPGSGN